MFSTHKFPPETRSISRGRRGRGGEGKERIGGETRVPSIPAESRFAPLGNETKLGDDLKHFLESKKIRERRAEIEKYSTISGCARAGNARN